MSKQSKTKTTKRFTVSVEQGRLIFREVVPEKSQAVPVVFDATYFAPSMGLEVQHDDEVEVSASVVSRMTLKRETLR